MRKSLSICLLLCMVLSMFAGSGFTLRDAEASEPAEQIAPVEEILVEEPIEEEASAEPPAEPSMDGVTPAASVAIGSGAAVPYEFLDGAWSVAVTFGTIDSPAVITLLDDVSIADSLVVPSGYYITIDLNGHVLKMTGWGSVLSINGNLTLRDSDPDATHSAPYADLTGGIITGGDYQIGGGAVINGTLTMTGGTITGNTADAGGGVWNFATFTMTGGSITGNTAEAGGGGVQNSGKFTMTGGSITGNTVEAGGCGGGVCNGDTFTMTGGSITGNRAGFDGGVRSFGTIKIGGTANVTGNFLVDGTTKSNLCLTKGCTAVIQEGFCGSVGVTLANGKGAITSNGAASDAAYFTSDAFLYYPKLVTDHLELVSYTWSQLTDKTDTVTLEPPYGAAITEIDAISLSGTLCKSPANGMKAIYAADGGKYKYIQYDGSAWVAGGVASLADLRSENTFVIGTAHEHTWTFTLKDNIVTAFCPTDKVTQILTLEGRYGTYDGKAHAAEVTFTDGAGNAIGSFNGQTEYNVEYYVKSTKVYLDGAPVDAGIYVAEVSVCEQLDNGVQYYMAQSEFAIPKAQLAVGGSEVAEKVCDGTTDAVIRMGTVSGIVKGDDVTVTAVGSFDDAGVGIDKNVTVTYILSGTDKDNYSAPETQTLYADITKPDITEPDSFTKGRSPKTGDDSVIVPWLCIMTICGTAAVAVSRKRKEN